MIPIKQVLDRVDAPTNSSLSGFRYIREASFNPPTEVSVAYVEPAGDGEPLRLRLGLKFVADDAGTPIGSMY
eukprot:scaffold497_cov368-Prasinococcus_capsulatus_cf.AAC.18